MKNTRGKTLLERDEMEEKEEDKKGRREREKGLKDKLWRQSNWEREGEA